MNKNKTEIAEEPVERQFIADNLKKDNPPVFTRQPNKKQDDLFFNLLKKRYHPHPVEKVKVNPTTIEYRVNGKPVFTDRVQP